MAKLNEYLTVGEAAAFLGVSKDTLRRWDRAGKLRAHRHPITKYRLYLKKDLAAVLRRVREGTGDPQRTGQGVRKTAKRKKKR